MNSTIIGKVLDNYRILQNIGRGGMGFVFKALNIKLNKIVAIKIIAPALAMNDSFMSRFEAEAKTLAKLENRNIVRIHDLRVESDYSYIVMEYVEGVTLGRLIKEKGPIPWRQALKLFNQMLHAIDHAHKEGIIHRDIKPNNVLINRQGVVKITDFGLAKNQAEFGLTQSVTTGGTLFYMSPEQVKGLVYTDERSDIYALGFTLYEMLTGSTPFSTDHTDFDIREAIIRTKFPQPHQLNKKIPTKLGRIVDQAINKKPEDRFQSVAEFQDSINEFNEDEDAKITKLQEAAALKNGQVQSSPVSLQTKKTPTVKKQPTKIVKNNSSKFTPKIIYYSVAASVILLLTVLKFMGLLDFSKSLKNTEGLVSITSIPNHAQVFINGDSIGRTPIDKHPIMGSSATIFVMKNDYFSLDTVLDIENDKSIQLDTELQPAAQLEFEIEPSDAVLYIDGKNIPSEKWNKVLLPVGEHNLILEHEDYDSYKAEFKAEQGVNIPLRLSLTTQDVVKSERPSLVQKESLFKVSSNPSNASVFLDDEYVGKTPFQSSILEERTYVLKLSKPGYQDLTDRFNLAAGDPIQLNKQLILLSGTIKFISNPAGAQIYLGDKLVKGLTPFTYQKVPPGENTVTIKKEGFAEYKSNIDVKAGNIQTIDVNLQQLFGSISILVIPWGNIFIDDQLISKESQLKQTMDLAAGFHQLRVEHPTLGTYDKSIRVEDDKTTEVVVNFNKTHMVGIIAKDGQGGVINADILVDGKSTGEKTPVNLNLKTGTYTISVERNGYVLANGPRKITIDETFRDPLNFVLKKTSE